MSRIVAEQLTVEFPIIGVSRSFRTDLLARNVGGILRGSGGGHASGPVTVRALDGITFSVERGDRLGLIGHNGAGKSTLLRVLAKRYPPTGGTLEVSGKVVPLLSLGSGLDHDFTGYENILFYGLYLGMDRREIAIKSKEIAEFTELGDFLHLPIRTYSSGMLLRLTYAIATSVDPEILLVDELFGAGDARFYKKAKERMERMLEASSILVLSTHSLNLINDYCNKTVVLDKGRSLYFGATADAIKFYIEHVLR